MTLLSLALAALAASVCALIALRARDALAERGEWRRLAALQPDNPAPYDPAMVAGLPEAAQRFFNFAIRPGTPLLTVAEIGMGGEFSLGSRAQPNYRPMAARQILAAPQGFLWTLQIPGAVPLSGSDSGRWTRFRILGLIPIARVGDDADHARAAYGRYVAEALLWTPAALLPAPGITWTAVDSDTARVTVAHAGLSQTVELRVDAAGQPADIRFLRWTNANPERKYRLQPFGALPGDFREVEGFRLPFRVDAGNLFGTDAYFPFFKARLSALRFPPPPPRRAS